MAIHVDALAEDGIFEADEALLKEPIMYDLGETCSFDDFDRNRREHLARLRQSGLPTVLQTEDEQAFVMQSAEAYRELLRRLDYAECVAGIQRGLEDHRRGDTVELDEAFEQLRSGAWRK